MSEKIIDTENVELIVSAEEVDTDFVDCRLKDVSIGFDAETTECENYRKAIAARQTEYSGTLVFEPSPKFLLFYLGWLTAQEDT